MRIPVASDEKIRVDRAHGAFHSDTPFPCILDNSCEDDPTFLALGTFPCSDPVSDVCADPLALDACPVSLSI